MILDFRAFEADYDNKKGGKFWGNIGAGVLVFAKDTKKFLVAMRSEHVNEPNTYGVVGGKVDDENGDLKKEALRELKEETGYSGNIDMQILSIYKVSSFEYHTYLGIVDKQYEPVPHPEHEWENDFFKWVSLEDLFLLKPKHFGLKFTLDKSFEKLNYINSVKSAINEIAKCPSCKHEFNYLDEPEVGMGYVKCPKCGKPVTQKNII